MRNRKMIAAAAMTAALAGGGLVGATLGNPLASGAQDGTTTTTEATTGTDAPDAGRPHGGPGGGFDREVAAETLGLTTEELQTELEAGKTLATIAEEQGVEKQALIDALVAAGEARLDEAKAALPERVAELVDSTLPAGGPGGEHGGRGGPGGRGGANLEAAAEALGMTTDELHTALEDGSTIADVAKVQGVDQQAVIDAMVASAKEHIAQEVTDGKITQEQADARIAELEERITTMVEQGRPERPADAPEGN